MLEVGSVHQLLQVLELTRRAKLRGLPLRRAYQDAIHEVSSRHQVRYQTIGDLCRRRLGLADMDGFVALLTQWLAGDRAPLQQRILQHSESAARAMVDDYFSGERSPLPSPGGSTSASGRKVPVAGTKLVHEEAVGHVPLEEIRLRLPTDLSKRLHLAQLAKLGATREETAIALMERGYAVERPRIRTALDIL